MRTAPLAPHINVTPMIDVMLVLLIIFMIVVPVIATQVDLPVAEHSVPRPEEPGEITLIIDARGALFIEIAGSQVPGVGLRQQLTALYQTRTSDRILYLKADTTLPYGVIERAMADARAAGVRVVAAVTERGRVPPMQSVR